MTIVQFNFADIAGFAGDGTLRVRSPLDRPSTTSPSVVLMGDWHEVDIVDGAATLTVEAGPVQVSARMGSWWRSWDLVVPDQGEPVTLAELLDGTVVWPAPVVGAAQAARDAAQAAAVQAQETVDGLDEILHELATALADFGEILSETTVSDAGKILTVGESGTPEWLEPPDTGPSRSVAVVIGPAAPGVEFPPLAAADGLTSIDQLPVFCTAVLTGADAMAQGFTLDGHQIRFKKLTNTTYTYLPDSSTAQAYGLQFGAGQDVRFFGLLTTDGFYTIRDTSYTTVTAAAIATGTNTTAGVVSASTLRDVLDTAKTPGVVVNSDPAGGTPVAFSGRNGAVVIGAGATTNAGTGWGPEVVIGRNAQTRFAGGSVVIGDGAKGSSNSGGVVIGLNAEANGLNYPMAIGVKAEATASQSLALGRAAKAVHVNSTAVGVDATTTQADQVMLGTASQTVAMPGKATVGSGIRQFTLSSREGAGGKTEAVLQFATGAPVVIGTEPS